MKITIIGAGRVASYFGSCFIQAKHEVVEVYNRSRLDGVKLAKSLGAQFVDQIGKLNPKSDIFLIAVSDDAIEDVSCQLTSAEGLVLHTSGASSLDTLSKHHIKCGVIWPLVSVKQNMSRADKSFPIILEIKQKEDLNVLKLLAGSISDNIVNCNGEERLSYHLAAVIANNFTNHLRHLASQFLESRGLDYKNLFPLMNAEINTLDNSSPKDSQTGPARRGDLKTIKSHLDILKHTKVTKLKLIYSLLTTSIFETYHEDNKATQH